MEIKVGVAVDENMTAPEQQNALAGTADRKWQAFFREGGKEGSAQQPSIDEKVLPKIDGVDALIWMQTFGSMQGWQEFAQVQLGPSNPQDYTNWAHTDRKRSQIEFQEGVS
eukprot:gnl/TRDRNA2_/TRDRNA2_139075_c0_seq2.p2 gnl/TRDRNA2_/TRDRNA2_139075_c0~~gnl/TRDRNA2_/TRDRNA2_139075_c0_seq2.p2  ORF type:complete len:111 (+),score=28.05 gnl/TRDRNA2_/TRDRNA2_139075_c0_seq2:69-401(+)